MKSCALYCLIISNLLIFLFSWILFLCYFLNLNCASPNPHGLLFAGWNSGTVWSYFSSFCVGLGVLHSEGWLLFIFPNQPKIAILSWYLVKHTMKLINMVDGAVTCCTGSCYLGRVASDISLYVFVWYNSLGMSPFLDYFR